MNPSRAIRYVSPTVANRFSAAPRTVRIDTNASYGQERSLPLPSSLGLYSRQRTRIQPGRRLYTTASPGIESGTEIETQRIQTDSDLPEEMRHMMRRLTNPVVVCTSSEGTTPRGMTMSSFTSLTLSPSPLVTFNIAAPSRTLDAIISSQSFNIHILSGDIHGAKVADHFSRGNTEPDVFAGLESAGLEQVSEPGEAPRLAGEGVLYILKCNILKEVATYGMFPVRDHVIVIGDVREMIPVGEENEERHGLAYADRTYRRLGPGITTQ